LTASISNYIPPSFISSTVFTFSPGLASTQTVTASGNPVPNVCLASGSLGAHFSLGACGAGSLTISFDGSTSATVGDFPLSFSATSSVGSVTQSASVHVGTDVKIVSPAILNTTYNQNVNFTVVAAGVPKPALTIDPGVYLDGLTFVDNGNGTATISGVAGPATLLGPCVNGGYDPTTQNVLGSTNFTVDVETPEPASAGLCAAALAALFLRKGTRDRMRKKASGRSC
jgi:hypothetical protein